MSSGRRGVLMDFGGVLYDFEVREEEGFSKMGLEVSDLLKRAGAEKLTSSVADSMVRRGYAAYESWKASMSRRLEPTEITQWEFWHELVGCELSAQGRAVLGIASRQLSERLEEVLFERTLKPGAMEACQYLTKQGFLVGCVSNTLAGSGCRKLLKRDGMEQVLAVTLFSDEIGLRKPNPRLVALAMSALGLSASRTWFVGDRYSRDVELARRASLAGVVVLRSWQTEEDDGQSACGTKVHMAETFGDVVPIVTGAR